MPTLTFPVSSAGLSLPVLIGLDGQTTTNRLRAGQRIQPPVLARGLLDTGTSVTSVTSSVLSQLGIPAIASNTTQTAGGPVPIQLFSVSLNVISPTLPSSAWLTLANLIVVELPVSLPDTDVLIGLD